MRHESVFSPAALAMSLGTRITSGQSYLVGLDALAIPAILPRDPGQGVTKERQQLDEREGSEREKMWGAVDNIHWKSVASIVAIEVDFGRSGEKRSEAGRQPSTSPPQVPAEVDAVGFFLPGRVVTHLTAYTAGC